jgi:hypothetical protein
VQRFVKLLQRCWNSSFEPGCDGKYDDIRVRVPR